MLRQWKGMGMIMENQRFFLRPMTGEDTDRIIRWRNQDFVRRNFIYQEPFTREGHENWIRTMIDTGRAVQFILCMDGEPVGFSLPKNMGEESHL